MASPRGRPSRSSPRGSDGGGDVVAGRNPVVEALRSAVPAKALYVTDDGDVRVAEAVRLARGAGVDVRQVSRPELDRRADGVPHQGVLLAVRPYAYADPGDLLRRAGDATALVVALDGVTDPHNLGAIVRSAAAFGAHGVVVPERRAAGVTPAVWKASAGTVANLPVARTVNLVRQLRAYQRDGLFVVGLAGEARTALADSRLLDGPLVLVVGAEGAGLSRLVREACDELVHVPIAPAAESLNASVAAGVALYEIARAR
ncbi:MAG: 23S rRNA (guanosine(2251)-2'-O)-methyltransferase RlmB [Streptosporangiales bacterium]|nr:23S rRNA (guanosine(2251)-2'-O)-methyltransferase RlmB [Streptosporangiales bacterium]